MLKDQCGILTNLELELINIMEKGNIIAYEKEGQDMNSTSNQLIKGKSHRKESERNTDGPSTIQPIQDSLLLAEKSIKHNSITEHDNPEQSSQTKPKENTGNKKADEKNNSLGEVAWEQVLHESKLPHTEFMDHLKKIITSE